MKPRLGCLKFLLASTVIAAVAITARYQWANVQPTPSFPAPLPAPSPNGFDLYLAAARAIVPGKPPVDEIYDTEATQLTPSEKSQRYSLGRHQEWLRQNSAAFSLFERARAADSRHPNTRGQSASMDIYRKFRELARSKVVQAKTLEGAKKWRAATDARLDVLEMANDISRGGNLIAGLVAIACEAIALNHFETLVPHLSATDCRQLNARFEKLEVSRPRFSEIMTEEKYNYQQAILNEWAKADVAKKDIFIPSFSALLTSMFWTRRSIIAGSDKMMDAFSAQTDKPLRLQKSVEAPNRYRDPINQIMHPVMERALFNSTRSLSGPQSQRMRLALRAYRLDNGTYPAALAALAPKYLAKIPIDPYGSGEAWHYKKEGDAYRVWSIGPDGKDDGGKPILPKGRSKRVIVWTDSIGDVVVRP